MNHEEIKDSIAAFCLGVLEEDEKNTVDLHLQAGCAECDSLLGEMRAVLDALPYSAPEEPAPAHVKQNIMAAIRPQTAHVAASSAVDHRVPDLSAQIRTVLERRWRRISWSLASALIVVAFALGLYSYELKRQVESLEAQMLLSDQIVRDLQTELINKNRILNVVDAPDLRVVDLNGQETAPGSRGKVFWDSQDRKAVFYAFGLPDAPADKDYQLWIFDGNQAVDAGVFPIDASGGAVYALETIANSANLTAFAVTLEPKGGVPQPTGSLYLLGAVKS